MLWTCSNLFNLLFDFCYGRFFQFLAKKRHQFQLLVEKAFQALTKLLHGPWSAHIVSTVMKTKNAYAMVKIFRYFWQCLLMAKVFQTWSSFLFQAVSVITVLEFALLTLRIRIVVWDIPQRCSGVWCWLS